MVKEVRVVTDVEVLISSILKLSLIAAPFVGIWFFFQRYPIGSWVVIASLIIGCLVLADIRYRSRLKHRLARRDGRLSQFEQSGFEEFNRCIDNIFQLKSGRLGDDDVRREMLVGEKFERKAALAALDEAQDAWPEPIFFLLWREASIKGRLFPRYRHAPMLPSGKNGSQVPRGMSQGMFVVMFVVPCALTYTPEWIHWASPFLGLAAVEGGWIVPSVQTLLYLWMAVASLLRGKATGRSWAVVLPLAAGATHMLLASSVLMNLAIEWTGGRGTSFLPLLPTVFNVIALVIGVREGKAGPAKNMPTTSTTGCVFGALILGTAAFGAATATAATSEVVPLFMSASHPSQQGFVRIINHSGQSSEVAVTATDDGGRVAGTERFVLAAWETRHFNSNDLELGNAAKGLVGVGAGNGHWRLVVESDLSLEVLAYVRTSDGFLTSMHDRARKPGLWHLVPTFNPGSNRNQVSKLRIVNTATAEATVGIIGIDDRGAESEEIGVVLTAGVAFTLTAQELEAGMGGLTGALGDGSGKWQLFVRSDQHILVQSLLESETGHLTNLSTSVDATDYVLPSASPPAYATGNFALDYAGIGVIFPGGIANVNRVFYVWDLHHDGVFAYTADGERWAERDFPTVELTLGGFTDDDERLYLLDVSNDRVLAYTTGGRRTPVVEYDFTLRGRGVERCIGYANGRFYVAFDDGVDVYEDGELVEEAGFDLAVGRDPIDIAAGPNGLLYILGGGAVFAYQPSGDPVGDAHFDLAADNGDPKGIVYANRRFYVADGDARMVFAYTARGQLVE